MNHSFRTGDRDNLPLNIIKIVYSEQNWNLLCLVAYLLVRLQVLTAVLITISVLGCQLWFSWTIHTLNMKAVSLPKKSEVPPINTACSSHSFIVFKSTDLILLHSVTHAL